MREVTIKLNDMAIANIQLGFVGENNHTKIIFVCDEVFDDYPDAIPTLIVTPPVGDNYTATVTKIGDNVEWSVASTDLTASGDGELQLKFTEDGTIVRSYTAQTNIQTSINPNGGGGGGGTTDYNELDNKPQIAGTTLSGNKTLANLGIMPEPASEGTAGQVLTTNGAGGRSWTTPASGGAQIDDTAGDGDTDKVWSADKTYDVTNTLSSAISTLEYEVESLDPPVPPVNIPFVLGFINNNGTQDTGTPSGNYCITDYVDLEDAVAISYTGEMGSTRAVFWYDNEKAFLSNSLNLGDRTAFYENILMLKPNGAKYVRLQSKTMQASNPPEEEPKVTVFYAENYLEILSHGIVGDGVTDDTKAVQKIVNMGESVVFPHRDKILITEPIRVRLGYARVIDGNGTNIIIDDDFYALSVTGSLTTSSNSTGMDSYVMHNEADTLITNLRITSEDGISGGGIEVTKTLKLKLAGNYIFNVENGIRVYGQNRDMIISENHFHSMYASGILIDNGANIHQCNVIGNILMYAQDCICANTPSEIANFQIVGNDLELGSYPPETYTTATCLKFVGNSNSHISEMEITGNTIQGHNGSVYDIVMEGVADHEVKNVSIVGNHISNSQDSAINMKYVKNIVISGNQYNSVVHYVYEMDGGITNVMISGEAATNCGGKLHAASTATLNGVKCKDVRFLTNDTVSIQTSNATEVDVWDEKDITVSGSTPTITAVPNARYICGEVSSLSFTPCANGVCEVVFTSGSTPTTLSVPNTVIWSDDFDPSDLDASTTYALNILNGTMGVAAKWA